MELETTAPLEIHNYFVEGAINWPYVHPRNSVCIPYLLPAGDVDVGRPA
jgi:hypothetical protein